MYNYVNGNKNNTNKQNKPKHWPNRRVAKEPAQCGDFIGGSSSSFGDGIKLKRKAMNTFLCSTDRPFKFSGRLNEDVNTYTAFQSKGNLFLTINQVAINQKQTQINKGGMPDTYLTSGTYIKSFYSVICHPSGVKIGMMGDKHKRLHHRVDSRCTYPKIISEKYKK